MISVSTEGFKWTVTRSMQGSISQASQKLEVDKVSNVKYLYYGATLKRNNKKSKSDEYNRAEEHN